LEQVGMPVQLYFPMMHAAPFGDGFAVQQVWGRPDLIFSI